MKRTTFGPRIATVGFLAIAGASLAADPAGVSVVRPTRGDIVRYVALPGSLRANQQVTVQARVAGFVKSIAVDRGDRVKAGQSLAEIEVPELVSERAKQAAEARVAEVDARRLGEARQRSPDLVTPHALDVANGRLEMARADLEKTETLLRYANLAAPFDGTVTARFVDPGAFVPAGAAGGASAVVTLADTRVLRALVPVPETEAVYVKAGLPVRVSVEGLTNVLVGTVSRHAGSIDEASRTLAVEADLPNPGDQLRPGMYAMVRVGVERHAGALLVPADAVLVEKGAASVFVAEGGRSRKLPVKLGFSDGPVVEVLSGMGDGVSVIVPARTAPADGAPVSPKDAR